jgi:hypothetical protein
LIEPLPLNSAQQAIDIHEDVIEGESCRVAQPNAMFVFGLIVTETLRPLFHNEPTRAAGGIG